MINKIFKFVIVSYIFLIMAACSTLPKQEQTLYPQMDAKDSTFLSDAGWCWYQDPRAIIANGKLIVGGISGQSGDIRVGVYDLEKGVQDGEAVLTEKFEIDDHNGPVFYHRPDDRLVAVWAKHGKEDKHHFAISEVGNYLKWSKPKILKHAFDKDPNNYWGGVTYMNLYSIKNQKRLYNFFRMGSDLNPYFTASDDFGDSWGKETHFIADEVEGHQRPYVRYTQINDNKIGLFFSDAHPRVYGNSVYYASFDGESFYKVNGEKIKDFSEGPLRPSETDKIYKGSETMEKPEGFGSVPNAAWTTDVETDRDENVFLAYTLYLSNKDQRFRIANWDGKKWHDREIAFAGPSLYEIEASYTGLITLDPAAPEQIAISTNVDPNTGENIRNQYEIYVAGVSDKDTRETVQWMPITRNSSEKNFRPSIVSGDGYSVLLWMRGEFPHFEDFDTSIVGRVLTRPKSH